MDWLRRGLIFLILLPACSLNQRGTIDEAFAGYVEDFENKVGVPVLGVNITFQPLKPPIIGVCATGMQMSEIHIDPDAWLILADPGREQLVYHELGHCVLNLGHNDATAILDGRRVEGSIMNTYWFGNRSYYLTYRENYKVALKNNTVVSQHNPSLVDLLLGGSIAKLLKAFSY